MTIQFPGTINTEFSTQKPQKPYFDIFEICLPNPCWSRRSGSERCNDKSGSAEVFGWQ